MLGIGIWAVPHDFGVPNGCRHHPTFSVKIESWRSFQGYPTFGGTVVVRYLQ